MNNKNQYILYLAIFFSVILKPAFFQIKVLREGGMADSTSWFIYNLASVNKAKLKFNYTLKKPIQGVNVCMRISSNNATSNIAGSTNLLKDKCLTDF